MVATVIGDRDVFALQGRCTVVSQCGLGALLPGDIALGDVVLLELHFPNSPETLRVRATVRHSQRPNYGLEFLTLSDEARRVIARYCELRGRPTRELLIDILRKHFRRRED